MRLSTRLGRVLVLAPHADDEVLGCGGTIARLAAEAGEVHIAIVTVGHEPRFEQSQVDQVCAEARRAHAVLGVTGTIFLGLVAAELDRMPHADLNRTISGVIGQVRPDTLFVPFLGDLHLDHRLVFEAAMVAARPRGSDYPLRIIAYETLSETNWAAPSISPSFEPNLFIDISEHLEIKLQAFSCFISQCRDFPDERSLKTMAALAAVRGSTVTREAAEAFVLIREVD